MKRFYSILLAVSTAAGLLPTVACAADIYTADNAALIAFAENGASASGKDDGCEINGAAVTVTKAGAYVFSGACADGSITVQKELEGVTLVLDGLALTSKTTAAVTLNKDSEATLIAAAGTENTLADGAAENDEKAALKVKSGARLALSGAGTLSVKGNFKNGVKGAAESAITVDGLTLNIEAADDGLSCDDALTIRGGSITVAAGGDAIKASPDTADTAAPDTVSKGDITVSGGTLKLTAAGDGVQADGALTVTGGIFQVQTNGGCQTQLSDTDSSCKGLKAAGTLTLSGGEFTMDTADDAFHTNSVLYVTGGAYAVQTGDDAFHADNTLAIGTEGSSATATPAIRIAACYEGLEAAKIYLYSGSVDLTATDDGVNAATGDGGRTQNAAALYLLGGALTVDAGGDGLDSNGDIVMTGGTAEIYGAATGGNGALDYDGTFTQTGGTLLAVGMGQMAQAPTASAGTQDYVAFGQVSQAGGMGGAQRPQDGAQPTSPDNAAGAQPTPQDGAGTRPEKGRLGERPTGGGSGMDGGPAAAESALGIAAGVALEIRDSGGAAVYTAKARKAAGSVVFSSPAVQGGETYTLSVGGAEALSAEATEATGTAVPDTSFSLSGAGVDAAANDDGAQAGNVSGSEQKSVPASLYAAAAQCLSAGLCGGLNGGLCTAVGACLAALF